MKYLNPIAIGFWISTASFGYAFGGASGAAIGLAIGTSISTLASLFL